MAGLQRSAQTFRRSGSSGLVWDERFLTEEAAGAAAGSRRQQQPELRHSRSVGSVAALLRRGGGVGSEADRDDDKKRKLLALAKPNLKSHHQKQKQQEEMVVVVNGSRKAFRTRDVLAPAAEPPSPRVPAGCCAPCAIFRDAAGPGAGGSSALPRRAKKR